MRVIMNNASNFQFKSRGIAVLMVSAAMLGLGSSAQAALDLTLSEPGFSPVTETDASSPGQVDFVGTYGNFTTNIVIGYTNLSTGTNTGQLQLESLDVTNVTGGATDTLTVTLDETSPFTFPGTSSSTLNMTSALGGTLTPSSAGDSVTFQSYVTPSVGSTITSGLQSYTATSATVGTDSFDVPNASMMFTRTASYTLESVTNLSIAPGEASNISGTTTVSVVPEPAVAALLGVAPLLGLARRRRNLSAN